MLRPLPRSATPARGLLPATARALALWLAVAPPVWAETPTGGAVTIPVPPLAAPAVVAAPASVPAAAASVRIAPHRAIYRMTMVSARNGSPVVDVRGKMLFQWGDSCDGWTTEQRFRLNFAYAEGEEAKTNTSYISWEAKDGLAYRFNVRKTINGQLDEEVKGEASLTVEGGAGSSHFVRPEESTLALQPGTLFPSAHSIALIQAAMAGERFLSRTVFDGADTDGATEISAVIGPPQAAPPTAAATTAPGGGDDAKTGIAAALLAETGWPVRLAFFPVKGTAAVPEYEMSVLLLANGVTRQLRIDYGDFSVAATLESLEALPQHGC